LAESEQTRRFTVKIVGPDLKHRDNVTGTLDLRTRRLSNFPDLPDEVRQELGQFTPGMHLNDAWERRVGNFVYQMYFE
jgi:hypothetical protein